MISALIMLAAQPVTATLPSQCRTTFVGANVWTGTAFETRDLSIDGDRFVAVPPVDAARIQASWAYLIPPFVDAHTHTVDEPTADDAVHRTNIATGIFYALNPNNVRTAGATPKPTTAQVELIATGGGVTSPGGHPRPLYERLATMRRLGALTVAELAGRAFHEATTPDAARAAVRAVAANGATTVKLYLLDHDGPQSGGLAPEPFRAAVAEAKRLKLMPIAHVETVPDFRLAVSAGVAGVVHMPGYLARSERPDAVWRLTPADAAAARSANVIVVTTIYPAFLQLDGIRLRAAQAVQQHNLALLRDASVTLAAGADAYGKTVLDELTLLRATTIFDGAELLRMATENGARLAMPGRQVGRLAPGYEASFLLLYADPVKSWSALGDPLTGMRGGLGLFDKARLLPAGCKPA